MVQPFQTLLNVALLTPVTLRGIRPIFSDEVGNEETGEPDRVSSDLIVNRQIPDAAPEERLRDEEVLFRASDLTEEVLGRFLDVRSKQAQIRQLFLAYERERMIPDDRFLSYVRFLESMHRQLFPVEPSEVSDYKRKLDLILAGISPEYRQFVSGRMKYGYEPSLAARLHKLARPWKSLFAEFCGGRQRFANQLDSIANHRNFLAHQLDESERQLDGDQVHRSNLLLMVLFRLNVLDDVGFTPEQSETIIRRTFLFGDLKRRFAPQ